MYSAYDTLWALVPRGSLALWPAWDPRTNTSDGLLAAVGFGPGIPWDAVTGGWFGSQIWLDATHPDGATHYIAGHGSFSGTRGWSLRITGAGNATLRVYNAALAPIEVSVGGLVANRFNTILVEFDAVGGIIAITVNNGTRTTAAIVGYSVPLASDQLGIARRGDITTVTLGAVGGTHSALGRTGHVLTATMRLIFWTVAKLFGLSSWGEPAGGETLGNPNADHKWVAHVLTDRRPAASTLIKTGVTDDLFHHRLFA